ncbi:MAG TPA: CapA family protein [Dehalococcoidia bacterium]|nr:CapA family protein [Dehalococcoidia bacterium]
MAGIRVMISRAGREPVDPRMSQGRVDTTVRCVPIALVALLLLAGCASGATSGGEATAPPQRLPLRCQTDCEPFEIVFTGDVLLGDAAQPWLERYGFAWAFEHMAPLLRADAVIGNLEGPLTTRTRRQYSDQRWSYQADPKAAQALAEVGFDAFGFANNHTYDRGPIGLADTLRHAREAGLAIFGAGLDAAEAAAPLLIETPYGDVGVVAFTSGARFGAEAGPSHPGMALLSPEAAERGYRLAREAGARWVIAFVHWGENYATVTDEQRRRARVLASAGYDLVVGHHPHIAQGAEWIDDTLVLYSLGNFVFGTPGRFGPSAPGYGLVARVVLDGDGIDRVELTGIVTDNDIVAFRPRPCDPASSDAILESLDSPTAAFCGTALIEWPRGTTLPSAATRATRP